MAKQPLQVDLKNLDPAFQQLAETVRKVSLLTESGAVYLRIKGELPNE